MKPLFSNFRDKIAKSNQADSESAERQPVDEGKPMKKVRMRVEGLVQGVGFRYTTKMTAEKIGVFGIVRNESDGSVYIEANGAPNKIDSFIEAVRKSPTPSGKVDHLSVEEDESIEERNKFSVTN